MVKVGRIKTTIWENRTDAGKSYFSLTITRTYRADNGDWKDTATFSPEDLPRIRLASDKAFDKINELMEQQQATQKAAFNRLRQIKDAVQKGHLPKRSMQNVRNKAPKANKLNFECIAPKESVS